MSTETRARTAEVRRLRVLFLTSIFPNPVAPTLGVFHAQLARHLAGECDLQVVNPQPWCPSLPWISLPDRWQAYAQIPMRYTAAGIEVSSPKYPMLPAVSESIRAGLMLPTLVRTVGRLHRQRPFDVVAGLWLYPDGVAASWTARALGLPMVLAGLGCDVNLCLDDPGKRVQIVSAVRRARRTIVVAEALKARLVAAGASPETITTIPNGVDAALFQPKDRLGCRRRLSLPADRKVLLFVGRLSEEKGVRDLLHACGQLGRRRRDFDVYVVGDGDEQKEGEAIVRAGGMEGRVHFAGTQPHAAVAVWLGACDVLVLSSLREGCPNIVIEALACGRPVVGTAVGAVPDLVGPSSGLIVPPADPAALAEALNQALDARWDPVAIAKAGAANSWERAARDYMRVFQTAAASVRKGAAVVDERLTTS